MLSMSKEITEKARKFDLFVAPLELRNYKILDPEKAEAYLRWVIMQHGKTKSRH